MLLLLFFPPHKLKSTKTNSLEKVQFLFILVDANHIIASDQDTRKRACAHVRVRLTPPTPPYPPNAHKQSNGKGHRL